MKYLILGGGVAGTTAAINIRKLDTEGAITIVSEESAPFYSRIRLIELLSGSIREEALIIKREIWYEDNRIELISNSRVIKIDAGQMTATLDSSSTIGFDRLLIALGASCRLPRIPGIDMPGVFTLRNIEDARKIRAHINEQTKAVVVGGGVLGLEAGNALLKAGCDVTVVEALPRLLPRQTDPESSAMLQKKLESFGLSFLIGKQPKEIIGDEKANALFLEDGKRVSGGTFLISAGIEPNISLALSSGIKCNRGILVDDRMETSIAGVYSAGDCAEHRGVIYGIWPAAQSQGEIAGVNMAGGNSLYEGTTPSNTLKIAGVNLFVMGDIDPDGKLESHVTKDENAFVYKKIVIRDSKIVGAIMLGDVAERNKLQTAIENATSYDSFMK